MKRASEQVKGQETPEPLGEGGSFEVLVPASRNEHSVLAATLDGLSPRECRSLDSIRDPLEAVRARLGALGMAGPDAVAGAQSGESSRQGQITKTGSMLARRLLFESAWHYSRQPRLGATLANRQAGQPDHILAIANRAQQRLCTVSRRMKARGKPHNVTVVACARQLAGFLWAAAIAD